MHRVLTLLALAVAVAAGLPGAVLAQVVVPTAVAAKKLHDLGFPADPVIALQRWRAETGRTEMGSITEAEVDALLAQPDPEFMGAMVGNPFTGMGLALRHKTRADAEREATRLCRANGGGADCSNPQAVRDDQCVAIVGYSVVIDRRPTHRTSVAVSTDLQRSMQAAREACPAGASHPSLCRPLVNFCGDGRALEIFEENKAASARQMAAR